MFISGHGVYVVRVICPSFVFSVFKKTEFNKVISGSSSEFLDLSSKSGVCHLKYIMASGKM